MTSIPVALPSPKSRATFATILFRYEYCAFCPTRESIPQFRRNPLPDRLIWTGPGSQGCLRAAPQEVYVDSTLGTCSNPNDDAADLFDVSFFETCFFYRLARSDETIAEVF